MDFDLPRNISFDVKYPRWGWSRSAAVLITSRKILENPHRATTDDRNSD
jgi:hypothetical protein